MLGASLSSFTTTTPRQPLTHPCATPGTQEEAERVAQDRELTRDCHSASKFQDFCPQVLLAAHTRNSNDNKYNENNIIYCMRKYYVRYGSAQLILLNPRDADTVLISQVGKQVTNINLCVNLTSNQWIHSGAQAEPLTAACTAYTESRHCSHQWR